MKWDDVLAAVIAALRADSALMTALGGARIVPMESGVERKVPDLRYTLIFDREEEVMNPILVQFDYWAKDRAQAVVIESRLRTIVGARVRRTLGGVEMATLYEDSRDGTDPQPGVVHRSLDFRFVPVRNRTAIA